jgi:hypothetical protein
MYNQFIQKLKSNSRFIVFLAIMVFTVLSFGVKQNEEKENVKKLLTFLDESFIAIDNTFNNLSNQSLVLENKEKGYDTVINSLKELNKDINIYKLTLPNESGAEEYQKVRFDLSEIYVLSQEKSNIAIEVFDRRKSIINEAANYYNAKIPESLIFKNDLEKTLSGWNKVIEFQKAELKQIEIKESRESQEMKIKKDEELYQKAIEINKNSQETLSAETKKQIILLLEPLQIRKYDGFLRLQIDTLETPAFGEKLKTLQESVKQLKRVCNL